MQRQRESLVVDAVAKQQTFAKRWVAIERRILRRRKIPGEEDAGLTLEQELRREMLSF